MKLTEVVFLRQLAGFISIDTAGKLFLSIALLHDSELQPVSMVLVGNTESPQATITLSHSYSLQL